MQPTIEGFILYDSKDIASISCRTTKGAIINAPHNDKQASHLVINYIQQRIDS